MLVHLRREKDDKVWRSVTKSHRASAITAALHGLGSNVLRLLLSDRAGRRTYRRRLPGADIDLSSLLLGHSNGLLKERFLSMALTKIWDIDSPEDSGKKKKKRKPIRISVCHVWNKEPHPSMDDGEQGFLPLQRGWGQTWPSSGCPPLSPPPPSSAPPQGAIAQPHPGSPTDPSEHTKNKCFSGWLSLLLGAYSSAEAIQELCFLFTPIIDPFELIRLICVAQRGEVMILIFSLVLVSLYINSLITGQLF